MATIGALSADQARFHQVVVGGTRLDATVVRAWIGCESGWNIFKTSHNYLNIGPGRSYASADHAALATVSLINTSSHYGGIRASVSQGGQAQIAAIKASPWDAGRYATGCLDTAYRSLAGGGTTPDPPLAGSATGVNLAALAAAAPGAPGARAAAANPLGDLFGSLFGGALENLAKLALTLVITIGAFALIALGLNRLTGTPASQRFKQIAAIGGTAAGGAGIAGAAAAAAA